LVSISTVGLVGLCQAAGSSRGLKIYVIRAKDVIGRARYIIGAVLGDGGIAIMIRYFFMHLFRFGIYLIIF
jgi:hypothetical protein